MSNVECWNCGRTGYYASDCRESWSGDKGSGKCKGKGKGKSKSKSKSKGKGQGKLNSVETAIGKKDGWKQERQISNRVKNMLKDGGTKRMQTDGGQTSSQDQVQVQDGGQQTVRHRGNQKDRLVQLKSTVLSRSTSNKIDGELRQEQSFQIWARSR